MLLYKSIMSNIISNYERAIIQNKEDEYMRYLSFLLHDTIKYYVPGTNSLRGMRPGFMMMSCNQEIINCLEKTTMSNIWIQNDLYVLFKAQNHGNNKTKIFKHFILIGRKSTILELFPYSWIEGLIIKPEDKYILPKFLTVTKNNVMKEYMIDSMNKLKWLDYDSVIEYQNLLYFFGIKDNVISQPNPTIYITNENTC
jgi:hypothetical protein